MLPVRIGEIPIPALECRTGGPATRTTTTAHPRAFASTLAPRRRGLRLPPAVLVLSMTGTYGERNRTFPRKSGLVGTDFYETDGRPASRTPLGEMNEGAIRGNTTIKPEIPREKCSVANENNDAEHDQRGFKSRHSPHG